MPQPLSGTGQGLAYPQGLYPNALFGGEYGAATNILTLAPGEALPIRAGRFMIDPGKYGSVQYLDPVTQLWTLLRDANASQSLNVWSDGFNLRVANLTGCPVSAVITNGGNNAYVQGTTVVTPSAGNSTWQPIVGGAVNLTVSITSVTGGAQGGSGYGIAPLVFFDAPPSPGVQATGVAVLSSGSVSSITVTNQGAGYTIAPGIAIFPNPADPNYTSGSIVTAAAVCSLTGAGSVTAVICTNSGAPVASTMSLTITGAGASATANPLFLQTTTSVTVGNAGAGYGTFTALTTTGGGNTVASPSFTNPVIQLYEFVPRQAQIALAMSGTGITSVTSIVDGGLFLSTPIAAPITNGIVTTISTLTIVLGSANTTLRIQELA